MHRKFVKIITVLFLIMGMVACGTKPEETITLKTADQKSAKEENSKKVENIFVYVCGAVEKEGVYELPAGSRVYEAVQKAGGFTEDAATTFVNQAEIVNDEERLYIPTNDEVIEQNALDDGKMDLNTATKEELMTIPGVGESKAIAIIQYREEVGKFQKIEDVMNVSGIKEGLFHKIKEYIKV